MKRITDKQRIEELEKALRGLLECYDQFNASPGSFEDAYYKLAKYAASQWATARTAIATAPPARPDGCATDR